MKRKSKKLTPRRLIQALLACAYSGQCSFRQLAFEVGLLLDGPGDSTQLPNPDKRNEPGTNPDTYSKQAFWERIDSSAVDFVKAVTARAIKESAAKCCSFNLKQLPGIARILIGDSSVLTFNPSLSEHFPGSSNQHGVKTAQARFQLVFDLLQGNWLHARIDAYRRTDRSAAADIVGAIIGKGDLLIRDLGYAVIPVWKEIAQKGAFFLSRMAHPVAVFDELGRQLNLLALVKKHTPNPGDTHSMNIELSKARRMGCRLIIRNDGEKTGQERRARLAEERKRRGCNHSKKYLQLQNWTLLVTNVGESSASIEQLCELYTLRWRIENIFKLAKSETHLNDLLTHRSNPHHIQLLLWGWILGMVKLGTTHLLSLTDQQMSGAGEITLKPVEHSVFKSMKRLLQLCVLQIQLTAAGTVEELIRRFKIQCNYHDRYEKRKRISIPDRIQRVLEIPPDLLGLT